MNREADIKLNITLWNKKIPSVFLLLIEINGLVLWANVAVVRAGAKNAKPGGS